MAQFWLMKSEPDVYSMDMLVRDGKQNWDGVRNYTARNNLRAMALGDLALFYHSSCEPPGVAGLARITRTKLVDETQFDPASKYFDPKATREKPIWDCAEVEVVRRLPRFVSLHEIRVDPALSDMPLLQRGMRLSVQPVTPDQFERIVAKADEPAPDPDMLESMLRALPKPKPKKKQVVAKKKPTSKKQKKPAKKKKR